MSCAAVLHGYPVVRTCVIRGPSCTLCEVNVSLSAKGNTELPTSLTRAVIPRNVDSNYRCHHKV